MHHTKEEYEGTVIGHSIAHKIVEQHGKDIIPNQDFRKRTTFYFTIPLKYNP